MQQNDTKAVLQLKAIELLQSSLNTPNSSVVNTLNYTFNISIESRGDALNKLVFIIVSVDIMNSDQSFLLGAISVSCVFEIANFKEVIKMDPEGQVIIPEGLMHILNSLAISTTRGVLFATFKGTFLHAAVLPMIDPTQIKNDNRLK